MQNEILLFKDSFERMIETKEVNLDVLPTIEKLREEIKEKKDSAMRRNLTPHQLFHIYHSEKISNNVLDSISERLKRAKENQDNPKIADDSLAIYPSLFMLVRNLEILNFDDESLETFPLLGLSSNLQIMAMRRNLFFNVEAIKEENLAKARDIICNIKTEE